LSNSYIIATVKNLGREDIKTEDIKVYVENQEANVFLNPSILYPNQIGKVYITFIPPSMEYNIYKVVFLIEGRRITRNVKYFCKLLLLSQQNANLTLVAYSTLHWVVFNYITGNYLIYQSTDGDLNAELEPSE
jgi:hypothetical protein